MNVKFSLIRMDAPAPTIHIDGDVITVNGTAYDLGPLEPGDQLPASATDCPFFVGTIEREAAGISLTILVPHGPPTGENLSVRLARTTFTDLSGDVTLPEVIHD